MIQAHAHRGQQPVAGGDVVQDGRTPQRFLQSGETLHTWVEGLGEMRHTFR
ncbi:MAG: hypothetical protein WC642_06350 [Nocardioides sp.]|jgi:hypothetical protein